MESTTQESILEDFIEKPKTILFSKIAAICAGVSLLMLGAFLTTFYAADDASRSKIEIVLQVLVLAMYFSILVGVICTIIGLVKKEKLKYYKAIGALINIVMFLIFFVFMAFYLTLNWK